MVGLYQYLAKGYLGKLLVARVLFKPGTRILVTCPVLVNDTYVTGM
jgi:hypothetical protein